MNLERITSKILSDAELEAETIVSNAENNAKSLIENAKTEIETSEQNVQKEVQEKVKSIQERKMASARLEVQKADLKGRINVIDGIYEKALQKMIDLDSAKSVQLVTYLLEKYAENGDEIAFAKSFKYADEIKKCSVVKEKSLTFSKDYAPIKGGLILVGKTSDKDLSYESLLASDRENNQSDIGNKLK